MLFNLLPHRRVRELRWKRMRSTALRAVRECCTGSTSIPVCVCMWLSPLLPFCCCLCWSLLCSREVVELGGCSGRRRAGRRERDRGWGPCRAVPCRSAICSSRTLPLRQSTDRPTHSTRPARSLPPRTHSDCKAGDNHCTAPSRPFETRTSAAGRCSRSRPLVHHGSHRDCCCPSATSAQRQQQWTTLTSLQRSCRSSSRNHRHRTTTTTPTQ